MPASTTDKFSKTFNSVNPNVARVNASRSAGVTTLACDNLAGWPTDTVVHFSTYKVGTDGSVTAGTQIDWKGIVSANNITSLTRLAGATDAGSAVNDIVEMNPTGSWANNLVSGVLTQHNQDGTHGAVTATSVATTGAVTAGNGFTVTTGTVTLPAGSIETADLANDSVTAAKVASGVTRLGGASGSNASVVVPTAYTTYQTVTATSTGGEVELIYVANVHDGLSGAARTGHMKVQCDGVDVGNSDRIYYTPSNGAYASVTGMISHTPAAGTHTWTLKVSADTASATVLDYTGLRVQEIL